MRKNQFFVFDLFHPDGTLLSTSEIESQLKKIIEMAGKEADPDCVGSLTSQNRDEWTKARGDLLKAGNEATLRKIESSVFLLCLDDTRPVTLEEVF